MGISDHIAAGSIGGVFLLAKVAALVFCSSAEFRSLKKNGADDSSTGMLVADGVSLGAFAVIGTQNGVRAKLPLGITLVCGMMTATFGGLTRDILCQRPARILHAHADIYASTALAGSGAYMLCRAAGLPLAIRIGAGVGATAGLRVHAWTQGTRLPTWEGHMVVKG